MARRRYVQSKEPPYELIEISDDYQAPMRTDSGALWGDRSYDGMKAPDGTDISSRTKHREYMKANGLTTADDFSGSWAKAQTERDHYRQHGGAFSKGDIERAIHQVQNRR